MLRLTPLFALGALGLLCVNPEPSRSETSTENPSNFEAVKKEGAEALEALKGYTVEQRDEAAEGLEKTLAGLDAQIESLEERIQQKSAEMSDSARQKAEAHLRTLRGKRDSVAEWLGSLKHSSADTWEHVKSEFAESYRALGESLERAWAEF